MTLDNFIELSQYWPFLLKGVGWTFLISIIAIIGGSVLGLGVALMRVSPFWILRSICVVYVDFFRTTPLLVQLVWFYYAFPIVTKISLSEIEAGIMAMTLYSAAYLAEIFRAGILSVEKGQHEAAAALGFRPATTMWRIVLPQGIVRMIPAIANIFISKVKDSALVSTIGVPELLRQASVMGEFTALRMESLTIAALLFFCMTYPLSLGTNLLHKRFSSTERRPSTKPDAALPAPVTVGVRES